MGRIWAVDGTYVCSELFNIGNHHVLSPTSTTPINSEVAINRYRNEKWGSVAEFCRSETLTFQATKDVITYLQFKNYVHVKIEVEVN